MCLRKYNPSGVTGAHRWRIANVCQVADLRLEVHHQTKKVLLFVYERKRLRLTL